MKKTEELKTLNINSTFYKTRISRKFEKRKSWVPADAGKVMSFIPGTITDILVNKGQVVKKGDVVIVLDAMKMQNRLKCSCDGTVKNINVSKGDRVPKGVILVEIG